VQQTQTYPHEKPELKGLAGLVLIGLVCPVLVAAW